MLDAGSPDEIERFVRHGPSIKVLVREAKGSTPRVAGTQMLVQAGGMLGTIGGGQLEYMAVDAARAMLAGSDSTHGQATRNLSIPLGPQIGQCCGGHVTLLLSTLSPADAHALVQGAREALARQPRVYIFGAGHVGRALAQALQPVPVNCLLVDSRQEELALVPTTINQDWTVLPETHVRSAPPGSAFVILTHDHALDFILAREALGRGDAAYVGMIGSKTKRATFASWLEDEAGSRAGMEHLTMPIGASRLTDKRPAVIAAMVAAEVIEAVGILAESQVHA
jgi:xanthine dehydrogenase accessory factor